MKVTVPGCVCVHIDGTQNMRASIKDGTGRQDMTHAPTTRNPCPKTSLAHILNCLHSCQSGLAGAELAGAGSKHGADAAESPPNPKSVWTKVKNKDFGRPKDSPQMCRLLQLQWQITEDVIGRARRSGRAASHSLHFTSNFVKDRLHDLVKKMFSLPLGFNQLCSHAQLPWLLLTQWWDRITWIWYDECSSWETDTSG